MYIWQRRIQNLKQINIYIFYACPVYLCCRKYLEGFKQKELQLPFAWILSNNEQLMNHVCILKYHISLLESFTTICNIFFDRLTTVSYFTASKQFIFELLSIRYNFLPDIVSFNQCTCNPNYLMHCRQKHVNWNDRAIQTERWDSSNRKRRFVLHTERVFWFCYISMPTALKINLTIYLCIRLTLYMVLMGLSLVSILCKNVAGRWIWKTLDSISIAMWFVDLAF